MKLYREGQQDCGHFGPVYAITQVAGTHLPTPIVQRDSRPAYKKVLVISNVWNAMVQKYNSQIEA